jgi:hypothetical protein
MTTSITFHRPDFSKTSVSVLSSGTWTVQFYDDKHNCFTLFTSDSDSLINFAKIVTTQTKKELKKLDKQV